MPLKSRIAGVIFVASWVPAAARADLPKCPRHGPLRTIVAPSERDPALARRTLDQIFSELAERTRACPASEERPIELDVGWRPAGHVLVSVTMRTRTREISLERDADLAHVPADGVPLAVAIVADELLAEIFERVSAEPEPLATVTRPPPPAAPAASERPPAHRAFRFGLALGYEQLTSGLGMVGLDVDAAWIATSHFQAGLRLGLREASWMDRATTRTSRGFAISPYALVTTDVAAARGVGALGVVDVLGLDGTARASPALGVLGWQRLGARFVAWGDARVGGVLSDPAEFSALSGACVTFSIGIGTDW